MPISSAGAQAELSVWNQAYRLFTGKLVPQMPRESIAFTADHWTGLVKRIAQVGRATGSAAPFGSAFMTTYAPVAVVPFRRCTSRMPG